MRRDADDSCRLARNAGQVLLLSAKSDPKALMKSFNFRHTQPLNTNHHTIVSDIPFRQAPCK